MSILAPPVQTPESESSAKALKQDIRNIVAFLKGSWEQSMNRIWGEPGRFDREKTEAVLSSLGTDAAEAFSLSSDLVAFLVGLLQTRDPGAIAPILARVESLPAFTAHEDGTVTLDPEPEPEEPEA